MDRLREAARAALERTLSFENGIACEEDAREWFGHVLPALRRLRAALQEKTADGK